MTFTVTGSATDDVGVQSVGFTLRDANNRYLQPDGTVSSSRLHLPGRPRTWSARRAPRGPQEITVPHRGHLALQARAVDSAGQSDLDTADGTWIVSEDGEAPTVSISSPAVDGAAHGGAAPLTVTPGSPITFTGSADDDTDAGLVEISLRNNTTRENLASDGTWGTDVVQDWYRISPPNLSGTSYNWTYTTPFNLKPGNYTFPVRATDDLGSDHVVDQPGQAHDQRPGPR